MRVEIDDKAGMCSGVVKAIQLSEFELQKSQKLYCLGDIVHNQKEVDRLSSKGLIFINNEEFKLLRNARVLIRAHGEPPETYQIAKENNIEIIDASCKVVISLQNQIRFEYDEMKKHKGQVLIFGKATHPEVVGLVGQTNKKAIVIENIKDLSLIDYTKPIRLFSQTTKSMSDYLSLVEEIKKNIKIISPDMEKNFRYKNSICRQVSKREDNLREFAKNHDVVIFIGGANSSNGKFLFSICKEVNSYSFYVNDFSDIKNDWFNENMNVGVTGATSTPLWLMEDVVNKIQNI